MGCRFVSPWTYCIIDKTEIDLRIIFAIDKEHSMSRSKKIILTGFACLAVLLAVGLPLQQWTMAKGQKALHELAKEGGFCKTDGCEEGMAYASEYLGGEFGHSPAMVRWCMGVDVIAREELAFGNGLKPALTFLLYIPCGDAGSDATEE